MNTRTLAIGIAVFTSSVLLSSCSFVAGDARISAVGTSRVTTSTINAIPSTAPGASALIPVEGDVVLVERTGDDLEELALTRLTFPATAVWRIPITPPADIAAFRFKSRHDVALGYISEQAELIHHFFRHNDRMVLLTSRMDANDVIYVIVRHYDVATGKELLSRIVVVLPDHDEDTKLDRRFMSSISPDSTLFTVTDVAQDEDQWVQTVSIARLDGTIVRTHRNETPGDDRTLPRVLVANGGELYFVSLYDTKELRIAHVGAGGDSVEKSVPFRTPNDDRVVAVVNVTAVVDDDGSLTCALTGWSGNDFAAVQLVRYDRTRGATVHPAYSVSEELTSQLIGDDELDDGVVVDMLRGIL